MAFTTYIFKEDYARLQRDARGAAGGSLYGQWTSTGNPVVHVAISASGPQREEMEAFLFKSFMLCHIGEWRTAQDDSRSRQNLLSKYKGRGRERGGPSRFIVLEVAKQAVYPFLFVNQYQEHQGQAKVEILEGENPFNRRDVLTQSIVGYNQNSYQSSATAGSQSLLGHQQYPYQSSGAAAHQGQRYQIQHRAPQGQEARTLEDQWYAGDDGSAKLKYVLQKFKDIARDGTEVDMVRDTHTHDISMSFGDSHFKNWEVKFPPKFPQEGALLIDKIKQRTSHGSGAYQTSNESYGPQNRSGEQKMPSDDNVDNAVRKIVHFIKTGR